jgi:hypothetical protein
LVVSDVGSGSTAISSRAIQWWQQVFPDRREDVNAASVLKSPIGSVMNITMGDALPHGGDPG